MIILFEISSSSIYGVARALHPERSRRLDDVVRLYRSFRNDRPADLAIHREAIPSAAGSTRPTGGYRKVDIGTLDLDIATDPLDAHDLPTPCLARSANTVRIGL